MRDVVTPVKVGLLVVLGLVAFIIFFTLIRARVSSYESKEYWASFEDASGLEPKSEVRVAGVAVGSISRIDLVAGKARVHFTVRADVPVYPNAVVSRRSSSLLGDNLVEVDPGSPQPPLAPGAAPTLPSQRPLPSGSEIQRVREPPSMEDLFTTLGQAAGDIESVTGAVRELIASERGSVKEIIRNIAEVSEGLNTTVDRSSRQLDRVLSNADVITSEVRELTTAHAGDVGEIITNVKVITEQAREVVAAIRGVIGEHEGELAEAGGIQESLANLNKSLANLESITDRINRGEGTLGKLISDEELGEKVDLALTGAADYVNRLNRLKAQILLRSEYLFRAESAKNYVGLRLMPSPDKFFLFEVVDDPLGYVSRKTVVRTPPGQEEAANQAIRTTSDILKFSVEFGKRYSFATFRFGLIESTGGVGLDLHFLRDRLVFRLDVFDFANPEMEFPRIKAYANVLLLSHIFLTAGMDDLANPAVFETVTGELRAGRDAFVGGGLVFTDEDLEVIFGSLPSILP